ncbi:hypothetical protein CTI14_68885, partial [Methylobacterium radiotolerans]
MTDRDGLIIARRPDEAAWIGRPIRRHLDWLSDHLEQALHQAERRSRDGPRRPDHRPPPGRGGLDRQAD